MSNYLRPKVPGASVYLTVTLAERGSDLLVREIEALRHAVRVTRLRRPFQIDAWVVLPDHMHCVWTLPEGDADYSGRMGQIKATFSKALGHVRQAGVNSRMA
ncbi:MAG: REP-associated tyrosine transposase [Tabrizicola sp.]